MSFLEKKNAALVHVLEWAGLGPVSRKTRVTGPKSYFEIKISRKVGCVLTPNEVHFVS